MIRKVCFFGPKKIRFMQIESVLQTKNWSEPTKKKTTEKKTVFCSPGWGNENLFKWSRSHVQIGRHAHMW